MRVFIQSIIVQLLLSPYTFWKGCQALSPKKGCRVPFISFFVLELSLYFFGFISRNELPGNVVITIQYICNTWHIVSIYITLSLLVLELVRLSQRIKPWFPRWMRGHWQQTKLTLFFLIIFGVTGLMIHAYHTAMDPIVKNVYVTLPKAAEDQDSLTIITMNDLHIGEVIGRDSVQKYVVLSNVQHPDMVILAGDIMDYESRFTKNAHIEGDLKQLKASLSVYIVYGNHEYQANRNAKYRQL